VTLLELVGHENPYMIGFVDMLENPIGTWLIMEDHQRCNELSAANDRCTLCAIHSTFTGLS
jgi:hypothetical protein